MVNQYNMKFSIETKHGVYDLVAEDSSLRKVFGSVGDNILVRTYFPKNLLIVRRDDNQGKDIIQINALNPEKVKSKLESITGVDLSNHQI